MSQKANDWRGQPVEVGTKVIYHRNHNGIATWGIGKVTRVHPGSYGRVWVDIDWEEHSAGSTQARGVSVSHCTVWSPRFTTMVLRDAHG